MQRTSPFRLQCGDPWQSDKTCPPWAAHDKRIPNAPFTQLGTQNRQALIQVFLMKAVFAVGEINLLVVRLLSDKMHQK